MDPVSLADDIRRRLFVLVFVAVVIPIVVGFAVTDVLERDLLDAAVEGSFGLLLIALTILLLHLPKPKAVYYIVITALSALLIYLVVDPVEGASRLYWCFVYTPVVSFTIGRWGGTVFGVALLAVLVLVHSDMVPAGPAISQAVFLRFATAYVMLGILVHIAEYARERTHSTLAWEHNKLQVAHEEIRRLSITDQLTKLYNRQYLSERLPAEIERALRYERSLSIMLADADHFKAINDTFGHQAGDALLRLVAANLASSLRHDVDWIARYGGEEFLIVLPETELDGAMAAAERLREAVASAQVEWNGRKLSCTTSVGVAALRPDRPTSEKLIHAADRSLYMAKSQGRNCVVCGELFGQPG
jgi:diguanylate cyclase (GGDEF)-like protein